MFSCEYCEIFINSLLVKHFLFIIPLCDDRILWTSLGTKLRRLFITFPRPTALCPRPLSLLTFLRSPDQITFSQPLMMELLSHSSPSLKKYLFTAPSNNKSLPCHFLLPWTKLNLQPIRKFLSAKSLIIHKPVNCCVNWLAGFLWFKLKVIFK